MDRETAGRAVRWCCSELQKTQQCGAIDIVTGRGVHAHNKKSNLAQMVKEELGDLGLKFTNPQGNEGVVRVAIRPG